MKQYIVNLTNNLIGKNRFDEAFHQLSNPKTFIDHVKICLEVGDVKDMSPAKLGEIMCLFEIGDVMVHKKDIFEYVSYAGDCEEMLRELVSFCLACVIRDRLDKDCPHGTPRWEGRVPGFQAGFRNVIDELAAKRRR